MKRRLTLAVVLTLVVTAGLLMGATDDVKATPHLEPVIFVTSQGLCYDSIVLTDLPPHGRFQLLEEGGPTGLMTEFGPGDRGYLGGRWMIADGTGGFNYFSCPLLGPGEVCP